MKRSGQASDTRDKGSTGDAGHDEDSSVFEIKRGAKQGDPLSSLLFNSVSQVALKDDLVSWQSKGTGIRLGRMMCASNEAPKKWG